MVYNRYVGNTGRFIRVEDEPAIPDRPEHREHPDNREHFDDRERIERRERVESHRSERVEEPRQTPLGGGGLSSLLSGSGLSSLFGGKGGGLLGGKGSPGGKGLGFIDKFLPFGMDTGDLALIVLFFFLYIESGDDEFLIIMAFLAYSIFKDRPK